MFGAFGGLLGQSAEKKRQQQFSAQIKKQDKSESELEFISKYIDNLCKDPTLLSLKASIEKDEYEKILMAMQIVDLKLDDVVPQGENSTQQLNSLPFVIVSTGELILKQTYQDTVSEVRRIKAGEMIFPTDEEQAKAELFSSAAAPYQSSAVFSLSSTGTSQIILVDRQTIDHILQVSASRYEKEFKSKIESIKKGFPCIAKQEQRKQIVNSKHFRVYPNSGAGTVLTTPISGSKDIFLIVKGTVLVWIPKSKINPQYNEDFVMLGVLYPDTIFNESQALFSRDSIYGTMIVNTDNNSEPNEILQLSKESVSIVCESSGQDALKAGSDIRDRMYRQHIKRYQSYTVEELALKQQQFCDKFHLKLNTIRELFKKSMKDNKIVTHANIDQSIFNKNLLSFNKLSKQSGFQATELQGDRDDIASMVTPRLVSRANGVNSLTPAQQLSLIALRQSGRGLRDGTRTVNQKISDIDFEKVEEEKKTLSNLKTGGGFLIKKNIQQLDCSSIKDVNKIEEEKESEEQKLTKDEKDKVQENSKTSDNGINSSVSSEQTNEKDKLQGDQQQSSLKPLVDSQKKSLHQKLESSNLELLQKIGQSPKPTIEQSIGPLQQMNALKGATSNEFSLKSSIPAMRPISSVFMKIAQEDLTPNKPVVKTDDKFAAQRKKLLNFGI